MSASYTKVRTEGRDGWLEQRRMGVGCDDVAGIMGLSR